MLELFTFHMGKPQYRKTWQMTIISSPYMQKYFGFVHIVHQMWQALMVCDPCIFGINSVPTCLSKIGSTGLHWWGWFAIILPKQGSWHIEHVDGIFISARGLLLVLDCWSTLGATRHSTQHYGRHPTMCALRAGFYIHTHIAC